MFGKLTDLKGTKTWTEALSFFLFYTIFLVGLSTFLSHYMGVFGMIGGDVGIFFDGGYVHTMIGTLFVLLLSTMLLTHKGLTNDLLSILLVGVGVFLTYKVDVMLGLLPITYLTTIKGKTA